MIKNITRGHVEFEFEGRTAMIQGELAFRDGHESPDFIDFVVYRSSMKHWEPPHENEPFDEATKNRLLAALVDAFHEAKMTMSVD